MSQRDSRRGFRPRQNNNSNSFSGRSGQGRSYGGNRRGRNVIKYMRVEPDALIKKAQPQIELEYQAKHQFVDFDLNPTLTKNIVSKGYTTPTPIQDQIIPTILEGNDVIGLASTGTGKTAAFLIPLIQKITLDRNERVLIVAPTRELAVQIIDEGKSFTRDMRIFFSLVIGGVSMHGQIRDLSRRPQFVVGTPGRLKDMAERGVLRLHEFHTIVLDEVDRMLDMGFIHDMRSLIAQLPNDRHSLFFSATMSANGQEVAQEFLKDPVTIQVATQRASDNVDQDIVRVRGRNKIELLHDLLIQPEFEKVLIFGRTKHGTERLSRTLEERGFRTTAIHGNKTQNQRQRALNAFKRNEVDILLATDVAARGIDIDNITHVINYELPETYEDYIHRIGRTGRAQRTGFALTFID